MENSKENVTDETQKFLQDKEKGVEPLQLNKDDTETKLSGILCRQTTLSKEEAIELLRKHNYSLKLALFEYNKIDTVKNEKTSNQERYKLIRESLDGKYNNKFKG